MSSPCRTCHPNRCASFACAGHRKTQMSSRADAEGSGQGLLADVLDIGKRRCPRVLMQRAAVRDCWPT